jgi:hypothetical protein
MQLDVFEHSRDVVLHNAAIDALRKRNPGACAQAVLGKEAQAWLPAWALIAGSQLTNCLQLSRTGTDTRSEYCARIVLGLLLFERHGRPAELVEKRRKLRELQPALFARYMQGR